MSAELKAVPEPIRALSRDALASIVDQSVDCVKLISLDGRVEYMNYNGLCALEIDDLSALVGKPWLTLWPEEVHGTIAAACADAAAGRATRFDAFCPTAKGTPRWWDVSVSPVRGPDGSVSGILSVSRDATDAEEARQALEVTTAEMRHRLKNSYAMVASLLSSLARGTPAHEDFASEMIDRLVALSASQTLFAESNGGPTRVSELIPTLVKALDRPDCPVLVEALSDAEIDQGRADAIALVLGELAVNSAKHGALGSAGTIRISALHDASGLTVLWCERSDRPVEAHARAGGQGLKLMDRIVRARHGTLTLDWQLDGLDVTLRFGH